MPARAISMTATSSQSATRASGVARSLSRARKPSWSARRISAARNAMPPIRFRISWRNELLTASSVRVNPMRAKEHSVVISQKKNIHTRLFDRTTPYMALRKTNSRKKNQRLRSFSSHGVHADEATDDSDYQDHHDAQVVDVESVLDFDAFLEDEFEAHGHHELHQSEDRCDRLPVFDTKIDDDQAQDRLYGEHEQVDGLPRCLE